jgi:hypothetical protein
MRGVPSGNARIIARQCGLRWSERSDAHPEGGQVVIVEEGEVASTSSTEMSRRSSASTAVASARGDFQPCALRLLALAGRK